MASELIMPKELYVLTTELRLFWLIAVLYAASALAVVYHAIGKSPSIGKTARGMLWVTITFHAFLIILRTIEGGRAPFQSLYETLSWFAFTASLTYLVASVKWTTHLPQVFIAALSSGACFYALLTRSPAIDPLSPPLQSWWFEWHVILAFFSYAVFVVSSAAEVSRLIAAPFISRGFDDVLGINETSMETLRKSSHNLVLFGFPLLTFAVFSGAGWANEAWGRYWSWDPKETWSLITWTVFAMYLHAVRVDSMKGLPASMLNVAGFVCMMMTFLGVNWLAKLLGIPSLHVYAV